MSASCRKPQRQWKFRKVGLAVPGFYGPKKLWLQLDCLGAWTCHGQLTTKGPISRGYDLELPDQPTLWQVTHVSTGLGLCVTLGQDHARQVVEFMAARWPRPAKLTEDKALQQEMIHAMEAARECGDILFSYNHSEAETRLRELRQYEEAYLARQLLAAFADI